MGYKKGGFTLFRAFGCTFSGVIDLRFSCLQDGGNMELKRVTPG